MLRLSLLMATLAILIAPVCAVQAEEPAQVFLEALRDAGYYDIAIDYLSDLEKGDLITSEFRASLPFEKAEVLIASSSRISNLGLLEERLDEAQKLLTEYASKNQSLEVSARTLRYQGNLLFQRADIYLRQTKSDRATDGEKTELRNKAKGTLKESMESYKQARAKLKRLIDPADPEAYRIDPEDPASGKKLKQLQGAYVGVRLRLPMVTEQLADTYPEGDPKAKKLLVDAATIYKDVYDDYRRRHAGLQSCVFAARCEQKLGNYKLALELLNDIFELGNNSSLKPLKLDGYFLAADCWSKVKPYPHVEVVKRLEPAVKVLNRNEMRDQRWLRVMLELAIAQHKNAEAIKKKGGPGAKKASDDMARDAGRLLKSVSRVSGPYRDRAVQLASEWNISMRAPVDPNLKAPESFGDARERAKDMLGDLELASNEVNALRKKLKSEKDATKKAALQTEFDDAMVLLREQADGILKLLDLALELADDTTVRADINNVRFLQSFCYFASRQYFESALIGEYLLAKYPTVPGTQQAMPLMIQSYSSMLDSAKSEDKEFESTRLVNACNSVIDRWSGSLEAGSAASTMTRMSIIQKDFGAAEKYFLKVPKGSPYRNPLAIKVGRWMWSDLKNKLSAGEDPASLKEQLNNSKGYMAQGVAGADVSNLDYETALGALMLVDAYVLTGEVGKAVTQLESAAIAPLDLVKQKHPAISNTPLAGIYSRETYRTAIKTYLAAMKTGSDKQKWVNKASGVIAAMRQELEASNDPKDRTRITVIYQLIAKELKNDFDTLTSQDEKKEFAGALSTFLGSIAKESEDPKTIMWAGSTLRSVGESLVASEMAEESQPLFQSAVDALDAVEKMGFKGDPQEAEMLSKLKLQRALSQRGAGNYETAVEQLSEILRRNTNAINVQIEACETLQAWGKAKKMPDKYAAATNGTGSFKDPKTKRKKKLIWGWKKIALATRSNEKFRSTFFNALYHVAECRLEYGILAKNSGAIESAGREIANERKRDPTFAGMGNWAKKFEELEVRIKAALK